MRTTIPKKCEECNRSYLAFRASAKFCSDTCRLKAHYRRSDRFGRASALEKFGHKCYRCDASEGKLFVRKPPELSFKVPLCPECNSQVSKEIFRQNHPDAKRGYTKRTRILKETF